MKNSFYNQILNDVGLFIASILVNTSHVVHTLIRKPLSIFYTIVSFGGFISDKLAFTLQIQKEFLLNRILIAFFYARKY